jgi:hypothetical protein
METMTSVEEEKIRWNGEFQTGRLVGTAMRYTLWYIMGMTIFIVAMNFAIYVIPYLRR